MEQPLPPPDEVARVREYIARSREVYTEAALRRRLLTDGHDVAVVDEAFRQIAAETDPLATAERSTESRVSLYLVVFGSFVAALLLNLLVLPTLALGLMEVSGWLWLFALRAAGLFG